MVGGWITSYVFIFISWSRCCCCCCLLLLPTTSVLKRREMLGTSIAAVVLGCFYFCRLDCDASVMVVDCADVETGCMLEKYVTSPLLLLSFASILLLLLRRDMHFYVLAEVLLLLLIILLVGCATAAAGACDAYNISTEAERCTGYCFFLLRFCRLHCDASDVYCCCCSWLLLFLSFRLQCFGYGC